MEQGVGLSLYQEVKFVEKRVLCHSTSSGLMKHTFFVSFFIVQTLEK